MRASEGYGVMTNEEQVDIHVDFKTIDDNIDVMLQKSESGYVYLCEYSPESGPQVAVAVPANQLVVDPADLRGIVQLVVVDNEPDAYRLSIMHDFSRMHIATATVRA